jgi:hypothetical protein
VSTCPAFCLRLGWSFDADFLFLFLGFDDKNFIPAAPLTNAVGVYKGLDIEGFFGANTQVLGVNIQPITPPSPPNVIVAGLPNHVLQGGQSFSVQYNASPYYAFNLHSLRFACFLDTILSPVNVAETCTVKFTGFSPHGKQMATKSFTFTNNGLAVGQPFATANFPVVSWCNLGKVTIDVTTGKFLQLPSSSSMDIPADPPPPFFQTQTTLLSTPPTLTRSPSTTFTTLSKAKAAPLERLNSAFLTHAAAMLRLTTSSRPEAL